MDEKVSVIIPTLSKDPVTLKSLPNSVDVIISDWKTDDKGIYGLSVAKNIGVMKAKGDIIVFMDDDINFSKEFFYKLISSVDNGKVAGLKSQWHDYLIGRVLAMTKTDFIKAGGFDPLMIFSEDVEFSYRLLRMGYKLVEFPADLVEHISHPGRDPRNFIQYLRTNLIIAFKYPKYFRKIPRTIFDFYYHKIMKPREKGHKI
jgi:GT2 family glycosyltransferase